MQERNPNNARGVDVSHYQGQIDWEQVKASGISFAIVKATEGNYIVDDTLLMNVQSARSAGLAVGAYHFCRAHDVNSAIAEAKFFCDTLDSVGGVGILPPVLDVETTEASDKGTISAICKAWLEYVEKRYNVKPMIYSYPWFADNYLDESLSIYPLWLADYSNSQPADRAGWDKWTILQYSDKGQIPGINAPVDMNEFCEGVEGLFGYKMPVEIANELIAICGIHYEISKTQEDKDAWHKKANSLRLASGQEPTAPF